MVFSNFSSRKLSTNSVSSPRAGEAGTRAGDLGF